jgi:predicted lipoprotein with Yx(FWY)xxD motif
MARILISVATLVASLALAACGSDEETSAPAATGNDTVAVQSVDGLDDVLVDSSGQALYAADVEADGSVKCVDACESIWQPLTVASGEPTASSSDVGELAIVKRPDGSRQVAVDGKLLYTFAEDGAGEVTGNGFADEFGGQKFTWSAVLEGGELATAEDDASDSGSGYGY